MADLFCYYKYRMKGSGMRPITNTQIKARPQEIMRLENIYYPTGIHHYYHIENKHLTFCQADLNNKTSNLNF